MASSPVRTAVAAVSRWGSHIPYDSYVAAERAGARQKYFRNLNEADWTAIYGPSYRYSADFIHANPKSFGALTGHLARIANRTEEVAEILFRFTGVWCRMSGGLYLRALRDMNGVPRFNRHLEQALSPLQAALPADMSVKQIAAELTMAMQQSKAVSFKGGLTRTLDDKTLTAVLAITPAHIRHVLGAHLGEVRKALLVADRRFKPAHLNLRTRVAMAVGCTASALAFVLLYTALTCVTRSVASVWLCKMGMFAAALYFTAFMLRSVTVITARMSRSHLGYFPLRDPDVAREYTGLFEMSAGFLRRIRNSSYEWAMRDVLKRSDFSIEPLSKADEAGIEREMELARRQAALLWRNPDVPMPVRGLMLASSALNRMTDVIFSFDRIVCQTLVARPLKDRLFAYHQDLVHEPGISVSGRCNIKMHYRKASHTRWGRTRQAIASFVGHGGADCLGMATGCAACSTTWTAMNVQLGGGIVALGAIGEGTAMLGMGFASVCAMGWGASALTEVAGRGLHASWRLGQSASGPADSVLMPLSSGSSLDGVPLVKLVNGPVP